MKSNSNIFVTILWLLEVGCRQFLKIDIIRFLVCYLRFLYYFKLRKQFKTFYPMDFRSSLIPGNQKENLSTVSYNASYTKEKSFVELFHQFSGHRSQRLVNALCVCFSGTEGLRNLKCLSIGPRTEAELFSLASCGAKFRDIKAIDLQTYSPKITAADITEIPFESDYFDCIVAGWVLPYVTEKQKAADEIVRVAKNGAYVAISHSWYPEDDHYSNGDFTDGQKVIHGQELIKFFEKNVRCIVVDYDQSKIDPTKRGDLMLLFKIKKSE